MTAEIEFTDILYARIQVPGWLEPFLRIPEFVRLRGVRLSNVDSYQFKDFNGPTRWEHGIAVAALADRCARRRRLPLRKRIELVLAALLHDVATPPFAHTAEYVLEDFDHELETQRVLSATPSGSFSPDLPVFASQLPQFRKECRVLVRKLKLRDDPEEIADEVARMVVGEGDLGYLICGGLDLDNADNVTRACLYLGIRVDPTVPERIADWLADQPGPVSDLGAVSDVAVHEWIGYRNALYGAFYTASAEEIGRQAFLQHLMRRALRSGLSRRALVWNTDAGLLTRISALRDAASNSRIPSLAELVQRYQLLDPGLVLAQISIHDPELLRSVRLPQAVTWIEQEISGHDLEVFVIVSVRRHTDSSEPALFPAAIGTLMIFTLGDVKRNQLPDWLKTNVPEHARGKALRLAITAQIERALPQWLTCRDWLKLTPARKENLRENLDAVGDWSFRLTRNENFHSYPGTFVHPIPATLITCLGLKGELIVDPFGGLGQTAAEVVKHGGIAVSADANTVANLAARAKLTFCPTHTRQQIRAIGIGDLLMAKPAAPPNLNLIEKWHHPQTITELCHIKGYIEARQCAVERQFLLACFSAILPDATARRGKQHGYFADNTPLPKGMATPPYQNAVELFLVRIRRSVEYLERFYSLIEKAGNNPEDELRRVSIRHINVRGAQPSDYGVGLHTVAAVITSPPYLCMADYSLGQRLSYTWLNPERMDQDFQWEFGSRRSRFRRPTRALEEYLDGMRSFARTAARLLRKDGFLATVLGAPSAKAFAGADVLRMVDDIFADEGFDPLWTGRRPVQWHRNHGYQHLREEEISVRTLQRLP